MLWDLKSLNQTSNTSTSAAFRLKSYDGMILDDSSNIQIEVNSCSNYFIYLIPALKRALLDMI